MNTLHILRITGPPVGIIALLALCGVPTKQTAGGPKCGDVISSAVIHARTSHKRVFVKFGSTWCISCRRLDAFLKSPGVRPILDKHFEWVTIHFDEDSAHRAVENPGAEEWMINEGIKPALPAYAILDEQGKVVTSSTKPSRLTDLGPVFGEPFSYEDVSRFLHLLAEGAPSVSRVELKQFRALMEKEMEAWKE